MLSPQTIGVYIECAFVGNALWWSSKLAPKNKNIAKVRYIHKDEHNTIHLCKSR